MSVFDGIDVNNLANLLPSWNKIIAEDLMREIERDISERAKTIPEMRLFLAVKGYRQMLDTLTRASEGKTGADALKAMTVATRRYAKEKPSLSAATFRNPLVQNAEWMEAATALQHLHGKIQRMRARRGGKRSCVAHGAQPRPRFRRERNVGLILRLC